MGPKSVEIITNLVPLLRELQINNVLCGQTQYNKILTSINTTGIQLMKLKLSNVNLNENKIVNNLVELLASREILMTLDISWSKLTPRQLNKITQKLQDPDAYPLRNIRNLNISYNSLHFIENKPDFKDSEEVVENLINLVSNSNVLNHIDISGMNLGRDFNPDQFSLLDEPDGHCSHAPILSLALAIATNDNMLAVHLSDNGLRQDMDIFLEVLDFFGLSDQHLIP